MKTEQKIYALSAAFLATMMLLVCVAVYKDMAYPDPVDPEFTYLERYRGFDIYLLEGGHDPYYIVKQPRNNLCEVYINLSDLKHDLDQQQTELNINEVP